jgi:tRNA modification GTPase
MAKPDVVAAVATAAGRAAIGVVRLTGPDLTAYMHAVLGRVIPARRAVLTDFLDASGSALDTGIALFFPAPHSYTGEAVLELQGHGGPAVLDLVLRRCVEVGARLAEPGEFSRRAFLNGKLDLAQAESVADLIEASSEAAARAALRSLKGRFSQEVRALVAETIELRMLVEACIDFPEEDIDLLEERGARTRLKVIQERLEQVRKTAASGERLRQGLRVALIGRPNVGKSSLLNQLSGQDLAIVTEVPGTTRDTIRSEIVVQGVPIHLVDTAGLRDPHDAVEKLGIERSWASAREADVVLLISDEPNRAAEDGSFATQLRSTVPVVKVLNKIDLHGLEPTLPLPEAPEVRVSAKTGAGLDLLRRAILGAAAWEPQEEDVFMARARHLDALAAAGAFLSRAAASFGQLELLAEDLRLAQVELNRITGEFTSDDLLGEIFSHFCIGK